MEGIQDVSENRRMTKRAYLLIIPFLFAVAALWSGQMWIKMAVPLSCAAVVLWSLRGPGAGRRDPLWVAAALVLSATGDWFLAHRGGREGYFLAGIGFFFGAHAGYLAFALRHGRIRAWILAALLVVYLTYYVVWLYPAIESGAIAAAALVYLAISCVTLAAACGMRLPGRLKWPYVAGIALLVLSDTAISAAEFLTIAGIGWIILPTYYAGQLCVSWTATR